MKQSDIVQQAFLRAATVIALGRDDTGSPLFERHLIVLSDMLPMIPDHPDHALYALRTGAIALIEARLQKGMVDWDTLRWRLSLALRDYMVVGTAQSLERLDRMRAGV